MLKYLKNLSKLSFLWRQESILMMEIMDSRFHGNDIMETLDSRFHGNDIMIYIIDKNTRFPLSRE